MMFGYACTDTKELMPMPIAFAHRITQRLAECRKKGIIKFLRPDGKSQVSVEYRGGKPYRVRTVVVAAQHDPKPKHKEIRERIIKDVIHTVIPDEMIDKETQYFVNPTGRFVIGGPQGDCGLTGRKIIVDTYGGMGSHGGGAFSGKDPSKVDRSAAYMARHIAKNLVAAKVCDRCQVQLAYAIGVADPVSVMVEAYNEKRERLDPIPLERMIRELFPLKPARIIQYLDLLRPIYRQTAAYGHFGRNEKSFTWEKTDRVKDIREYMALRGSK
jgi:S-adenosylmethionine synthetase